MRTIDLHTHSTYSDGTMTPLQLLELAGRANIAALAITDHDTMAGTKEALHWGRQCGVAVLPAVEISASLDDTPLHILGYGIDENNTLLTAMLDRIQQARKLRNQGIAERLAVLGISVDLADLEAQCHGQVGRPHFARKLVEQGKVMRVQDAFIKFLRRGGAAYVARQKLAAEEAIATITDAGGLAVLAHPASLDPSLSNVSTLISRLKPHGLAGVEAYYPSHTRTTRNKILSLCDTHNLIATGGSDFHGLADDGLTLGSTADAPGIPFSLYETLLDRLSSLRTENAYPDSTSACPG